MSVSQTFPQRRRLKSPSQFAEVYATGLFEADQVLVINLRANSLPESRMGLSIPKVCGNAPIRNRWKRYCREAFRQQQHELPKGIDFVIRPRKGAKPDSEAVAHSLHKLLQRAASKLDRTS